MNTVAVYVKKHPKTWACPLIILAILSSCDKSPAPVQVSERPLEISSPTVVKTQAREGRLSLRSRIAYVDIQALIENEIPPTHNINDSRRLCKRVIGIKACGTANWNLNVMRQGALSVSGEKQQITVQAPISFDGIVGMEGKVAKALGLTQLDVNGSVVADIKLGLQVNEKWCPSINVSIDYVWTEKPTIVWRNTLDFSLEKIVSDALDQQLAQLEPRINNSIDCNKFREQLEEQWRSYTFAIDLPKSYDTNSVDPMHLNFTPTGFAFSGIHTDKDKLGLGFALDGLIVLENDPIAIAALPLPELQHVDYQQSKTDFDILLRSTYSQLENILEPQLLGKTFSSDSIAGKSSVTVNSIALLSNTTGITISVGFDANLPGSSGDTNGTVHLVASPNVNAETDQLTLHNIQLSNVIDSTLWSLLSNVFETQIISAIERNATINYGPQLRTVEQNIMTQLQDPSRTGGVVVTPKQLSISILNIIPEASSLAILARVSADLDIDIPVSLIQKTAQ